MTSTTSEKETSTMNIISSARFEQDPVRALAVGITLAGKSGIEARVQLADGTILAVSQLDGETGWIVDGRWAPGRSFPIFWNGRGSRCTMLVRADADVTALLGAVA